MRLRIMRSARRDLNEIFIYWQQQASLEVADHVMDSVVERFTLLKEQPMIGRKREEFGPDVRGFPAGKYIIYYRKKKGAVEILHVLHGARDQEAAFGKG